MHVKCKINTGLTVRMEIVVVVVEIVSCNITLNWDDSWWLMSDEHLKPVGDQSLGCHVGWLEARIGDLGSREGLVAWAPLCTLP